MSVYGNGTTTATSGANVRTDFYDRAGIKASVDELVYGKWVDAKSMPKKTGKTFKISRFRHILDDLNVNDQGIDGAGNIIGNTNIIFGNTKYADVASARTARDAVIASNSEDIVAYANATDDVTGITTLSIVASFTSSIAVGTVEVLNSAQGNILSAKARNSGDTANVVVNIDSLFSKIGDITTIITGGGNAYGSSRDVGVVSSGMPSLAEGAERVNRVGVTKETFETTLNRYGNFIEYDDEVEMFSEDSMQVEYREKLGRMAAEVYDDAVQLGMLGSVGVKLFGGDATSISTVSAGDVPTYNLFRLMAKRLKINKADKNTSMLSGSVKIGTTPINKAYYAFIGPDIKYAIEDMDKYKSVHEYGYATNVPMDEVGSIHETRFIETNRAMKYEGKGAGGIDVYPILYPTKGSYASVGLQGEGKIKFKAKAPGVATSEDPYGVKGLFSYNFFYAGIALQPEKIGCIYVASE